MTSVYQGKILQLQEKTSLRFRKWIFKLHTSYESSSLCAKHWRI